MVPKSDGANPCQFECHANGVMYRELFNDYIVIKLCGTAKKANPCQFECHAMGVMYRELLPEHFLRKVWQFFKLIINQRFLF
jgi:spore germination cell wall hydrolase CwlJ-like protein